MYAALVEGGVDDLMAKHVAHLFIREENFKSSELAIKQKWHLSSSQKPIIREKICILKGRWVRKIRGVGKKTVIELQFGIWGVRGLF